MLLDDGNGPFDDVGAVLGDRDCDVGGLGHRGVASGDGGAYSRGDRWRADSTLVKTGRPPCLTLSVEEVCRTRLDDLQVY
jgi:hypothetical protein